MRRRVLEEEKEYEQRMLELDRRVDADDQLTPAEWYAWRRWASHLHSPRRKREKRRKRGLPSYCVSFSLQSQTGVHTAACGAILPAVRVPTATCGTHLDHCPLPLVMALSCCSRAPTCVVRSLTMASLPFGNAQFFGSPSWWRCRFQGVTSASPYSSHGAHSNVPYEAGPGVLAAFATPVVARTTGQCGSRRFSPPQAHVAELRHFLCLTANNSS